MASNAKPNFSVAHSKANEILVKSRVISTFPFSPTELVKEQSAIKNNRHMPDGKAFYGVYKGVRVGVIKTYGKIATVFPDSDQSSVLKKRRK